MKFLLFFFFQEVLDFTE